MLILNMGSMYDRGTLPLEKLISHMLDQQLMIWTIGEFSPIFMTHAC